jgi:hypothetical protein
MNLNCAPPQQKQCVENAPVIPAEHVNSLIMFWTASGVIGWLDWMVTLFALIVGKIKSSGLYFRCRVCAFH